MIFRFWKSKFSVRQQIFNIYPDVVRKEADGHYNSGFFSNEIDAIEHFSK